MAEEGFREYASGGTVFETYRAIYSQQTPAHARANAGLRAGRRWGAREALARLAEIVDESDPDFADAQIFHAVSTANALRGDMAVRALFPDALWERVPSAWRARWDGGVTVRQLYGDMPWLPLVGLVHDLGKVLLLPEIAGLPQWSVVGDTFPVGVALDPAAVLHEHFAPTVAAELAYPPGVGLQNVLLSFGHDEYLACVLERSGTRLPAEAVYIVRFHSFYPWHNRLGYAHLASDEDWRLLPLLKFFQRSDLYSKHDELDADLERFRPMLEEYLPNDLEF
jgi:inositol oxygenase